MSCKHFAEGGVLRILAHVCTIDGRLGSNDGLVDEVVSKDSVHFDFLSWLLAFSDWSQPLFFEVFSSVLYVFIIAVEASELVVILVLVRLSGNKEEMLDKEQIIHNNLVGGVHCFVLGKQSGSRMSHLLCHLSCVRSHIQFAVVDVGTDQAHKQFILLHFDFLSALLALAAGRNPYSLRCFSSVLYVLIIANGSLGLVIILALVMRRRGRLFQMPPRTFRQSMH